ncbi:conserved hypothetical protein [Levilactobacillus brevis KB290]|uniref:Uncharacterized protein n=2 Tax=Levilactobacillus brevis TaxID=1580 RepID=Q03RW7_LEVBA|nr:hypothetical protein LVIS_0920 [Levilactobacillus brevis ATCC 367]BAN06686.1 conserved hypothetical protein [Levilactobacillus brevis KB290]
MKLGARWTKAIANQYRPKNPAKIANQEKVNAQKHIF